MVAYSVREKLYLVWELCGDCQLLYKKYLVSSKIKKQDASRSTSSLTFATRNFAKGYSRPKIFAPVDFKDLRLTIRLIQKICEYIFYFVMTCFILKYTSSMTYLF